MILSFAVYFIITILFSNFDYFSTKYIFILKKSKGERYSFKCDVAHCNKQMVALDNTEERECRWISGGTSQERDLIRSWVKK